MPPEEMRIVAERGEARGFDPAGSEHSIQKELHSSRAGDEGPMEPFISPNHFGDRHSVFSSAERPAGSILLAASTPFRKSFIPPGPVTKAQWSHSSVRITLGTVIVCSRARRGPRVRSCWQRALHSERASFLPGR